MPVSHTLPLMLDLLAQSLIARTRRIVEASGMPPAEVVVGRFNEVEPVELTTLPLVTSQAAAVKENLERIMKTLKDLNANLNYYALPDGDEPHAITLCLEVYSGPTTTTWAQTVTLETVFGRTTFGDVTLEFTE